MPWRVQTVETQHPQRGHFPSEQRYSYIIPYYRNMCCRHIYTKKSTRHCQVCKLFSDACFFFTLMHKIFFSSEFYAGCSRCCRGSPQEEEERQPWQQHHVISQKKQATWVKPPGAVRMWLSPEFLPAIRMSIVL